MCVEMFYIYIYIFNILSMYNILLVLNRWLVLSRFSFTVTYKIIIIIIIIKYTKF